MPRASTSAYTLDSPGFRKSTPRRAAAQRASTNIASTSAQLLQTAIELNGKGKERAATQDGVEPFKTAPEPARGRSKREGKRGTEDQQEKPSKRRKVTADQPTGASDIRETSSQLAINAQEPTQPGQDGSASRPPRKERKKKHVRIAAHTTADPSDGETSTYQPSAASDSDSDDAAVSRPIGLALANSGAAAAAAAAPDDKIDWADPLSIPTAQPFRSRRYWQSLELGICTSAVYDVARDESHLGKALVEWELLRQHRAAEEALARTAQSLEDGEVQRGPSRAGSAAVDTPHGSKVGTPEQPAVEEEDDDEEEDATPRPTKRPRQRRADISLPSHDPNRALTPFPVTRATAEQLEVDEDGVNLLPLPSAVALAKMARWPVHSSLVQWPSEGEAPAARSLDALEEALLTQYERFARLRNAATLPALAPPPPVARAPSAYAPGGPFERGKDGAMQDDSGTGSHSDSSDELDSLADDDDLLLVSESLPPSMTSIPPMIDKVLLRLLDLVPKAPLPAYDYWIQRTRTEELLIDDKRRGFVRDECAPGWEEVLAIAREMELPAHVVDELETQLVSLFGVPSRGTARRLPSPGLADKFVVRVYPRSSKAAAAQDDDEGPTSPTPSSAAGDADVETLDSRVARSTPAPPNTTSPAPSSDAARASDGVEDECTATGTARGGRGRRGPPRDRTAVAAGAPQVQRVYKPYVYSEAQRARKAAYKRERRRREKEQREAAFAEANSPSIAASNQAEASAAE